MNFTEYLRLNESNSDSRDGIQIANIQKEDLKPKDKYQLQQLIIALIGHKGIKADLNCIDTSLITDMSGLFYKPYPGSHTIKTGSDLLMILSNKYNPDKLQRFKGDISKWDVSRVTNMEDMFRDSDFNGDISGWDVSHVTNMSGMFMNSSFNKDIGNWDVSHVTNMSAMFRESNFLKDIGGWNTSNVEDMSFMFAESKFNKKIGKWNTSKVKNMRGMFYDSKFNQSVYYWDTSNVEDMSYMFAYYQFNRDLSAWDVSNVKNFTCMFQDYKYGISYLYDKWTVRRDADMTDFEFDGSSEEYKTRFDHKI